MAYSKNTWQSGDVVTSAKLNNIENGIANTNGNIAYTVDEDETITLSVSYNDVMTMLGNGIVPFLVMEGEYMFQVYYMNYHVVGGGNYVVGFFDASNNDTQVFMAQDGNSPLSNSNK